MQSKIFNLAHEEKVELVRVPILANKLYIENRNEKVNKIHKLFAIPSNFFLCQIIYHKLKHPLIFLKKEEEFS